MEREDGLLSKQILDSAGETAKPTENGYAARQCNGRRVDGERDIAVVWSEIKVTAEIAPE